MAFPPIKRTKMKAQMRNEDLLRVLINFTCVIIMVYVCLWNAFEQNIKASSKRIAMPIYAKNTVLEPQDQIQPKAQNVITNNSAVPHNIETGELKIGVLIPTTTLGLERKTLTNLNLTTLCLPSLFKSMEDKYTYKVYLGIDKTDYLGQAESKIKAMFRNVEIVKITPYSFSSAVNTIARKAYNDGMHYLVRITDDTVFTSNKWTTLGINVLKGYNPPNIGVVGPTCLEGSFNLYTHDMVHRTHMKIFGFYYPSFTNYLYAEKWITSVYQPSWATKVSTWVIQDYCDRNGYKYDEDFFREKRFKTLVSASKIVLERYIANITKA